VDATEWDERYRSSDLVWGLRPNLWVERELADLTPGSALDLACGEGRNAVWLATRGWQVTAVDFSQVGLDKGRQLELAASASGIEWVCADATTYRPAQPVDLALLCYLQLPADARRRSVRAAAEALAPGGTLLVVGHDSTNITDGSGGPQEPSVLYTATDLTADLDGCGLVIDVAAAVHRPVEGAERPAIDALLRAHRP
jgi:SAM-dependent methyltransferase